MGPDRRFVKDFVGDFITPPSGIVPDRGDLDVLCRFENVVFLVGRGYPKVTNLCLAMETMHKIKSEDEKKETKVTCFCGRQFDIVGSHVIEFE